MLEKLGKAEVDKTLEMGPNPVVGDIKKTAEKKKNIISITKKLFINS